jgi:hypothetical protein
VPPHVHRIHRQSLSRFGTVGWFVSGANHFHEVNTPSSSFNIRTPNVATSTPTHPRDLFNSPTESPNMADGGIDRKADEKIQFSTSKEVTVHPTFESMSLKGKFCRIAPFYVVVVLLI